MTDNNVETIANDMCSMSDVDFAQDMAARFDRMPRRQRQIWESSPLIADLLAKMKKKLM